MIRSGEPEVRIMAQKPGGYKTLKRNASED